MAVAGWTEDTAGEEESGRPLREALPSALPALPVVEGCERLAGELVFFARTERGANSLNCQKGRGPVPCVERKSISETAPSRMRAVSSCTVKPCSTEPSARWRLKSGFGGESDKGRCSVVGIVVMRGLLVGTPLLS